MAANRLKATLPSLQSTKVPREPILITENEGENFFPPSRLYLDLDAFLSVNALIYQPPHPRGASDGPVNTHAQDPIHQVSFAAAEFFWGEAVLLFYVGFGEK